MGARAHRIVKALVLVALIASSIAAGGAAATGPTCFGREPTLTGSEGPDTLVGTSSTDVILGLGGNDTISGGGGSDFICGGDGNDTISGGLGRDRLSGEAGADRLSGGAGDDRLLGGPGNDRLDGDDGTDSTTGGAGTDICLGTEAPASCEIFPPAGCSNPPRVPATAQTSNVTLAGSNAFQTHSSVGMCFEGHCDYDYLTMVAEARNDTGSSIHLGEATLKIYDGSGNQIGTRFAYPSADVLAPGQRAVFREITPSFLCDTGNGETCLFPDGWASWRFALNATFGAPSEWDDVVIGSRLSSLLQPPGGGAEAQGTATNTRGVPLDSVYWWVVLYDSAGRLVDLETTSSSFYSNPLTPGASAPFDITIYSDEPACFANARVGAAGS